MIILLKNGLEKSTVGDTWEDFALHVNFKSPRRQSSLTQYNSFT